MSKKGMYIVVEGLDGSGKSTQFKKIVEYMPGCAVTREPGGTPMGEAMRNILLDKTIPRAALTSMFLLSAGRADIVETLVRPKTKEGINVLSERNWLSTAAYQQSEGIDIEKIITVSKHAVQEFFIPDLTIFIDAPASVCLERMYNQKDFKPDHFEQNKIDFFERAHKNYLTQLKNIPNVAMIDGTLNEEEVWKQIKKVLDERVYGQEKR